MQMHFIHGAITNLHSIRIGASLGSASGTLTLLKVLVTRIYELKKSFLATPFCRKANMY